MAKTTPAVNRQDETEDPKITWRTWAAVGIAALSTFSQLLSVTGAAGVIAFIIPSIGGAANATWIISSITLVQASLCPLVARLSDLTGQRKWIMVGAATFGMVGACVACRAQNMNQLIGGQILIGVGTTVVGINSSIPSEVLPHKYRGYAQASVLYAANAASLVGSIGTGAMVRHPEGWRYIFYTLIAVYALVILGFGFLYNPPTPPDLVKRSFGELMHAIDLVGATLAAIGFSLTILGLTWGGGAYEWTDAHVLAPLIAGLASLVAFGVWEWKGRSDGILDHRIFRLSRNFALASFALAIEGWVYFSGVAAYIPQEILAQGYTTDALFVGCRSFIFTACGFLSCLGMSVYVARTKDMKRPLIVGFTLFLVAVIMFSQAKPGKAGDALLMGGLAVAGIGFAAPLVLLIAVVQLCAPPELIATVTAVVAAGRALGGTVGTAVVSSIRRSKLEERLPALVVPAAVQAGIPEPLLPTVVGILLGPGPAVLATVPGITPAMIGGILPAYQQASAYAYSYVWYSLIPFVFLAIVAVSCCTGVEDKMTNAVDRPYEDVTGAHATGIEGGHPMQTHTQAYDAKMEDAQLEGEAVKTS